MMVRISLRRMLMYFIIFGAFGYVLIIGVNLQTAILRLPPPTLPPPTSLTEAISRQVAQNKTIILALVDIGFIDMAVNFYQTSLKKFNITSYLFVGASRLACNQMAEMDIACYPYREDVGANKSSIYRSVEFNRKMHIRTDMIFEALNSSYTVIHSDVDMAFLQNPLPQIANVTGDISMMWDSGAHNAGFLIVRPTANGKLIYQTMKNKAKKSPKTDDQTFLNQAVSQCAKNKSLKCKISTLPVKNFPCGLDYFEKGKRMFAKQNPCTTCKVVHNNWIVSNEAKIYRFKETGLWHYDKNGYYSSTEAQYISFTTHNPTGDTNIDTIALKNALYLGSLLKRFVILPRFHKGSAELPLNSFFNMIVFDREFGNSYRENVFLGHPLVPEVIKKSSRAFVNNTLDWKNSANALKQLHNVKEHIIVLHNFNNISLTYDDAFKERIKRGFKAGWYRQL